MQTQRNLDELDMVVHCRSGRYLAKIPQVGLYATGDSLPKAIAALEFKKKSLLEELSAANALDQIPAADAEVPAKKTALTELGVFAAKAVIVVTLVLGAVGYTRHAVEAEINKITAPKIGGTVFWADVESSVARAADPTNDLPAAKKEALLADLRVLVNRWRPFVQEIGRLFSASNETSSAKP
jgi:hypothetical protein